MRGRREARQGRRGSGTRWGAGRRPACGGGGRTGRLLLGGAVAGLVAALCAGAVPALAATGATHGTGRRAGAHLTSSGSSGSSSLTCPAGEGTGSPGVTANGIDVGAISTLSGELAADFAGLVPGVEAYFKMVDSQGGVDGRKINLSWKLDDGGNPSTFQSLAQTLINQDHAFADFASTYFFNPTSFVANCTPTYGYNVTGDWSGAPNLFAAGGSVQYYPPIASQVGFVMNKVKAKSIAVLAYNVSSSSAACAAAITGLRKEGFDVSYSDLKLPPIDANVTPDVQRINAAHSQFILSCMDDTGNISLARAVQQYGLKVHMIWLNGADQSVIDQYSSLMQGVFFDLQHVPFSASTKTYPGLGTYVTAMEKAGYNSSQIHDELAIQGWESAALLVAGIKAAGSDLTQANVVKATNSLTDFTADGLGTPVNWGNAHTSAKGPFCTAFVEVKGKSLPSVFDYKGNVFNCFEVGGASATKPVPLPSGTPGT